MLRRPRPTQVFALAVLHARRGVQFRKTSEMNVAINTGKKEATKWVTKSTADFAKSTAAAKEAGLKPNDERSKSVAKADNAEVEQRMKDIREWTDIQTTRISTFRTGRNKRFGERFATYGAGFIVVYAIVYVAFFAVIFIAINTGYVSKFALFEMLYGVMGGMFEREDFFERVSKWENYIDFGFTFVLNELLDVVRVPISAGMYFFCRKAVTRFKPSIFRWHSPEYGIKDGAVRARSKVTKVTPAKDDPTK
jgi:hypothetical protein